MGKAVKVLVSVFFAQGINARDSWRTRCERQKDRGASHCGVKEVVVQEDLKVGEKVVVHPG